MPPSSLLLLPPSETSIVSSTLAEAPLLSVAVSSTVKRPEPVGRTVVSRPEALTKLSTIPLPSTMRQAARVTLTTPTLGSESAAVRTIVSSARGSSVTTVTRGITPTAAATAAAASSMPAPQVSVVQ